MLHGKEISVWVKLFDAIYTVYGNVIMQHMQYAFMTWLKDMRSIYLIRQCRVSVKDKKQSAKAT